MTSTSERVGRYQLLEPIGLGPCGTVARAKVFGVAGFERQFAVKRFHAELTITSALASALSAAARAYGSLEHPRIARMSEFGVAQGTTFTAVELVSGLDAARLVAEARLAGSNLAAGGALALVSQAARAVGYAHGRGLTHLGLAPTNVIVTADGDIKITDFGILAAGLPQRPTDVARLANRIQYLAPEQVANEATSAATDVFALGVIAYELVTGQRTFRGDTPQQVAQSIMNGPPPEPPLPRPIVRVLHRCLARSPFERFPDARALADALDAALRVAPVPGTRKDVGAQVKQTMDRLADLNANEMSGMVALHVGTGPVPRSAPSEISSFGRPDHDDPVPTTDFVRPDVPVPGPTPLISPATTMPEMPRPITTMAGVAPPPIPVPQGIGAPLRDGGAGQAPPGATLLGIANAKVPPKIPQIGPRVASQPIPTIPRISSPPPPPPPAADPPELQRPSEPMTPPPPAGIELRSAGRIEINPPSAFDPPVMDVSMVELFDDEGPVRGRAPSELAVPVETTTDVTIDRAASIGDDDETRPGEEPRGEIATQEMAQGFVERLREAARDKESLSVQMEVVAPPDDDIDPGASAAANASFAAALHEASGVYPRPVPPSGVAPVAPPVSQPRAPSADEPVQRPTPDPSAPLEPPPVTMAPPPPPPVRMSPPQPHADIPSLPVTREKKSSRVPLFVALALLGGGALAFGGWQLYTVMTDDDLPVPPKKIAAKADAGVAAKPDATQIATADAAASVTADAAVAVATIDAAQVAAAADAAVPADAAPVAVVVDAAAPAAIDAGAPVPTASDQLAITSTPSGAHVYLDGSDVGQTPVKLPAANDRHTVALLLPGHELYIAEVDGKGAFAIPLKEVTPTGGPAGIKVTKCKDKDRYYVFVDGKPTGMLCPTERIDVEVGPHTVEVYDAVSESRKKWDIVVKDTRLSVRVKIE